MYLQIAGVTEPLFTLITGIRSFPSMDAHVVLEIDHAAQYFAAHITDRLFSRFFARVDPHVVLKCAGVAAALAAHLADVRPLARVGEHVMLQGAPVTASFATDLTGERFFSSVFAQVIFEHAGTEAEQFAAVFLLRVSNSVSSQGRGREEALAAQFTDKISVS